MPSITSALRSLGNDGAVANARHWLEERQREDWLVAGLTRRIAAHDLALGESVVPAVAATLVAATAA
jgi:hypothetical protein